ncbi:MAG: 50S ribosomal protein L15 [Pseudomonadales bacterium]|nr:50S ribosomal protein L15 [Pseudomonadales bacterium]
MRLNDLHPAEGSKKPRRRVGRGSASGWGKTSTRGTKGQKSRKSGHVRPGFEGGQLSLQQRVPKFGFRTAKSLETAEVRLSELAKVEGDVVSLDTLKAANVVRKDKKRARIMLSGAIDRPVRVQGVKVTAGARAAIEAAGGSVDVAEAAE